MKRSVTGGRVVVVHGTGSVRAHVGDLLTRDGYSVESLDSTYRCMARVVDEPADLVVLGLAGLAEVELELIPALREETDAPRILVTFPAAQRETASRALAMGADAYLLEPFYAGELLRLASSLLATPESPPSVEVADPEPLRRLAREVAHAVSNPLQVVRLLLEKRNVTKKEIEEGLPPQLERVDEVVGRLRTFGSTEAGPASRAEAEELAARAADAAGVKLESSGHTIIRVDEAMYRAGLEALFAALLERQPKLSATMKDGVLRVPVNEDAFEGEEPLRLGDAIFVVGAERELRSGLALTRWLLEEQGGKLSIEHEGAAYVFRVSPLGSD
ncbi:MAG: ANTAR domain-containing protein [Planctomycetota bacterium]|jgi:DNA-binding response OmpR family regulator